MKIAVITSGILPVPAVQGGAVENLIDFYLEYNDIHKLHDITVYSVYHPDVKTHPALQSKVNHYDYVSSTSTIYKFLRRLYSFFYKTNHFYDAFLEFYFEATYRKISKQNYDLIILENRPGFAPRLSQRVKTPLIAHVHFDVLNNPKYEDAFRPLAGIISVSNYLYSKAPTIIRNKCITVYNGIDLTKFKSPSRLIRQKRRKELGIMDADIVLIFCGRLSPIKGIRELIQAIRLLKDNHIKLLVIGGSFFGNQNVEDDYIISVKEEAALIKERIIFTGFLPYSEIPNMLSIGDIAIIPSLCDDAFPTTTLEAMAMQLPIIASKRGGIPEQVDKSNAILIETNNIIDNLAKAIQTLASNKELREKMAIASFQRSFYYDKNTYAGRFFDAINDIIE